MAVWDTRASLGAAGEGPRRTGRARGSCAIATSTSTPSYHSDRKHTRGEDMREIEAGHLTALGELEALASAARNTRVIGPPQEEEFPCSG